MRSSSATSSRRRPWREYVRTAPDDELAELRRQHEAVLDAACAGRIDDDLVAEAQITDWNLHDTIIDALGNKIISSTYRVNSIKIRLINQAGTRLFGNIVRTRHARPSRHHRRPRGA